MQRAGVPLRHEQQRLDGADGAGVGPRGGLFLAQDDAHDEVLAVLPQPVVDEEAPRGAADAGEHMVAGGDHEDGAAEDGFVGDEQAVVLMVCVEVGQDGREGG